MLLLENVLPTANTPVEVRRLVNYILEPFHDDHEDDEKAYADICTNVNLETAMGIAPMLMHQRSVHLPCGLIGGILRH